MSDAEWSARRFDQKPSAIRAAGGSPATLLPFVCLYAAFGATFGLLGAGAPLVFRARGMPLAEIGLLQIIVLPIGLTFLWAPLVDRFEFPRLPHRIGWIVAMQLATAIGLLCLRNESWPVAALFAVALATSMATATMDVALEALVVETVARDRRAAVTTAKLCGSSLGGALGIGLLTMAPAAIDLPKALAIVACFDGLCLLPLLTYREAGEARAPARPSPELLTLGTRVRAIAGRAIALGLYFAVAIMVGEGANLLLLDLHVSLPMVGFITGPASTGVGVAMTLAAGVLMTRMPTLSLVLVLAAGVLASGVLFLLAALAGAPALGIAAALLDIACSAGLGVPVFTMIYRWAEGTSAATDYALLFGAIFLTCFPARVGAPALAGALGWPAYFGLCVPLYALATALLVRAIRRTP